MTSIVRDVRDIDPAARRALENMLGEPLREDQRIAVAVVRAEVAPPPPRQNEDGPVPALPEWCNVYEGLSEAEIDRLDQAIRRRLDLTRSTG